MPQSMNRCKFNICIFYGLPHGFLQYLLPNMMTSDNAASWINQKPA
jgi:hypothetical protein